MSNPSDIEQKLKEMEKHLATRYIAIADAYKRMSKVKDNYSLDIIQSGIDHLLKDTMELRGKIDKVRKEITAQWLHAGRDKSC